MGKLYLKKKGLRELILVLASRKIAKPNSGPFPKGNALLVSNVSFKVDLDPLHALTLFSKKFLCFLYLFITKSRVRKKISGSRLFYRFTSEDQIKVYFV